MGEIRDRIGNRWRGSGENSRYITKVQALLQEWNAGNLIPADELPRWQPIETAPSDPDDFGQTPMILLTTGRGRTFEGFWRRSDTDRFNPGWVSSIDPDAPAPYLNPTHWMPLPAPPETGE